MDHKTQHLSTTKSYGRPFVIRTLRQNNDDFVSKLRCRSSSCLDRPEADILRVILDFRKCSLSETGWTSTLVVNAVSAKIITP